jgi:hypothetical protein
VFELIIVLIIVRSFAAPYNLLGLVIFPDVRISYYSHVGTHKDLESNFLCRLSWKSVWFRMTYPQAKCIALECNMSKQVYSLGSALIWQISLSLKKIYSKKHFLCSCWYRPTLKEYFCRCCRQDCVGLLGRSSHTGVYPKVPGLSHNKVNNNTKHSSRSNTKGYGGKTH